jgi:hypothetical protein
MASYWDLLPAGAWPTQPFVPPYDPMLTLGGRHDTGVAVAAGSADAVGAGAGDLAVPDLSIRGKRADVAA